MLKRVVKGLYSFLNASSALQERKAAKKQARHQGGGLILDARCHAPPKRMCQEGWVSAM